jgi:hypothetical protein
MAVALPRQLGPVPDEETGITGELVRARGNHPDDELVRDDFPAGCQPFVEGIGFVQLGDDAACIRGVRGLQVLQGTLLGFLDVGTDFVIVGSHVRRFSFQSLAGFFLTKEQTYVMLRLFPSGVVTPFKPERGLIDSGCAVS